MTTLKMKSPRNLPLLLLVALLPFSGAFAANIKIKTNGEKLEFSPAKFSVKAGEKVTVTFTNASKSMEHKFVVGKTGSADKIMQDSLAAGAPTWTSTGPEVIKATAMLKPLAKETITFDAPKEKGDFPYICSFPGHGALMRGVMTVK
jgi:azurin